MQPPYFAPMGGLEKKRETCARSDTKDSSVRKEQKIFIVEGCWAKSHHSAGK